MEQINVDTSFLGFEGDLIIPEVIWENIGTYSLAYDRMARHLQFEENKISDTEKILIINHLIEEFE